MLTESSVSLLTGIFPKLLIYRGGQAVLVNVFSLLGQTVLHRRYLRATWNIPGFNCVNTKENTLKNHVVPTGTYPVYNTEIRLDLVYKLLEQIASTFPITIPTHKFNIVIKCKSVS